MCLYCVCVCTDTKRQKKKKKKKKSGYYSDRTQTHFFFPYFLLHSIEDWITKLQNHV